MIFHVDLMHIRGTGIRSRTDASWRTGIFIFASIIFLILAGLAERALAGSHDNTDELWDLGVRLDGKWKETCRDGGTSVFSANQTGSAVTFRYVNPCRTALRVYGYQKNDISIQGEFLERKFEDGLKHMITGKVQLRFPLGFKRICPEQWSRLVPVKGEIVVDEKFSKIKLTIPRSKIDQDCRISDLGTREVELRRPISVKSVRISQTEPQIPKPKQIQMVSSSPDKIPYAKITVIVEFDHSKNAIPVLDAYPVDIVVDNNGPKREVMARRVLSLQEHVYRIPWIKLVNK